MRCLALPSAGLSAAVAVFAFQVMASPAAHAASDPTGVWINDTGRGAVEIKDCGGALCGHVVWVKDGADSNGCGKQIIGNLKSAGGGRWDNGWIYSPEKKRKYDVEVKPLDNGRLRVMGYAGIKMFSKTMIWTKAPGDLVRCGTTLAKLPSDQANAADAAAAKNATPQPAAAPATEPAAKPVTEPKAEAPEAKSSAPVAEQPKSGAQDDTASASQNDANSEDNASGGGGPEIGGLDVGKFLKKTADGKCQIDTPWIKIKIDCER